MVSQIKRDIHANSTLSDLLEGITEKEIANIKVMAEYLRMSRESGDVSLQVKHQAPVSECQH